MRYQRSYTLSYALLILLTLFAPVKYGVSMKYVCVPLVLMLLFGIVGKGISLRLKFKPHFFVCLCWMIVMVYSTRHSDVVSWSPSARSFCFFLMAFALLYEIVPDDSNMDKIKCLYACLTLFCALWIVLQSFGGLNRHNFYFVSGRKDVNYLAAFMLPGAYFSMRFGFLEAREGKGIYRACVIATLIALLLIQSRAAFGTFLCVAVLCFFEYASKNKMTKTKLLVCVIVIAVMALAIVFIWNNPAFSRLTDVESYEEDGRFTIWEFAMEAYRKSPIVGSGLKASNIYSRAGTRYDTHNNYIDILGDSGIIGMCMFVLLSLQILRVPKGHRLHMFSFYVACMLPLGFINGLQTISFWLPLLLIAHEHTIIKRSANNDRHNHSAS